MWHAEEENKWLKAAVKLDEKQFAKPMDLGKEGEIKTGYAFYSVLDDEGDVVKEGTEKKITFTKLDFITARIGEEPSLVAVTPAQLQNWSKVFITAIPAKFVWK